MKLFVLYDSGICEVIRIYDSMDLAMSAAINRVALLEYTCVGFSADDEFAVIEYRDNHTGEKHALTVQAAVYSKGI